MINGIGNILESFRKLAPVPLIALGLGTGLVLFVPEEAAKALGVDSVRTSYRGIFGGVFIVSCSYLAAHLAWWVKVLVATRVKAHRLQLVREKHLRLLTPEEQGYLLPFVIDQVNTQKFAIDDGVIGGLNAKGIVYQASKLIDMLKGIPWNIQPWAKKYLQEHPECLEDAVFPPKPDRYGCW